MALGIEMHHPIHRVKAFEVLGAHRLRVVFADDVEGIVDLEPSTPALEIGSVGGRMKRDDNFLAWVGRGYAGLDWPAPALLAADNAGLRRAGKS